MHSMPPPASADSQDNACLLHLHYATLGSDVTCHIMIQLGVQAGIQFLGSTLCKEALSTRPTRHSCMTSLAGARVEVVLPVVHSNALPHSAVDAGAEEIHQTA